MSRADLVGVIAIVIAVFITALIACAADRPKPWTPPGYGKRRQTEWMREWRKKR